MFLSEPNLPYSPIQNPASERSERAINMSENRQKMTENGKKFSNFFEITEIDGNLVLKIMQVIFPNVPVMKLSFLKIFKSLKMTEIDRDNNRYKK